MMKLHSKWATQSLLPKEFVTYVKVGNRQVKKSFLSQKNQRIVAGFVKKFVCQF